MKMVTLIGPTLLVLAATASAQAPAQDPDAVFERAVADFRESRFVESAAGFDRLAKLIPDYAPALWQRGIVLYYAGRYND